MARKRVAEVPVETGGKMTFLLRFDEELHARVKQLAESAQISVNQLMQGVSRWMIQNAQLGEPSRDESGQLHSRPQAGCLWFGRPSSPPDLQMREALAREFGGSPDEYTEDAGNLVFALDFTERRVLLDDPDSGRRQGVPSKRTMGSAAKRKL